MAKKSKEPQPLKAGDAARAVLAAAVPEGEGLTMTQEEILAVVKKLKETEKLLAKLKKRNQRILDAEKSVETWKRHTDDLRADLNEAQKSWKQAVDKLQSEIKRQETQEELPFKDETRAADGAAAGKDAPTPPVPVDTAGATKLSEIGVSKAVVEKLSGMDVNTVTELEAYVATGKFVPGVIKGLAQSGIDRVADCLIAFRAANPKPADRDDRQKQCRGKKCKAIYPPELTKCPTCGDTLFDRIEPEPAPAQAQAELAKKPEAGTIFDKKSGGKS